MQVLLAPKRPCYLLCLINRHSRRFFTVLGLESSADDTCAAIVTSRRQILSNVVVKQHEKFGGIYPPEAIASHQNRDRDIWSVNISSRISHASIPCLVLKPGAIQKALREAQVAATDLDGIAFTRGPGMGGCLSVASNAAKGIAAVLGKPIVGVHHMHAHALTPFLTLPPSELPAYPFLTLLITGGHTLLLLARSPASFSTLATTPDDSIGNAYDKVSKLLALPWTSLGPGAALEQFCLDHPDPDPSLVKHVPELTLPLAQRGQLIFSYSGLYSAVQRHVEALSAAGLTDEHKARVAWAFQRAAVGQLEEKVRLGVRWCERHGVDVRHVVVSGGVASNRFLRERLQNCVDSIDASYPVSLVFPPMALCTDNAAMIAWVAMSRLQNNDHDPYEIDLRPIWNIEDLHL